MFKNISRRTFLKQTGIAAAASALPLNIIEFANGQDKEAGFKVAYISDAHINHIKGTKFTNNFDKGLKRAVVTVNFMSPQPDFVIFGGDLAQLGKKEEIDHGLEIMSDLRSPVRWVIGEHDYYLDLGKYWEEKIGRLYYSFDHKGVHFVVLNSIVTYDKWTHERWPSAEERMRQMARLDNPQGSPFMVGEKQRAWLKEDLSKINKDTPIIVLSHSPIYKIFKHWNFWTEDAEQVQAILKPFNKVTVLHGHVHQLLYNQIGSISFYGLMSTAWPWPYPMSYSQEPNDVPKITVPMNRADPHSERDGTGVGYYNVENGRIVKEYDLWENTPRTVHYSEKEGHPVDTKFQDPANRIPPQEHY